MANERYTQAIAEKNTTVKQTEKLATLLLNRINSLTASDADALKFVKLEDSTLKFYRTVETENVEPAFELSLPEEYFLDQASTKFIQDFKFADGNYPEGTVDPGLDGKPVMVLAVKGQKSATATYSFVDLAALSDTGKADKISGGTAGNIAVIAEDGGYEDSGVSFEDLNTFVTDHSGDIEILKTEVTNIKKDILDIKGDIVDIKGDVNTLTTEVTDIQTDITDIKTNITNLEADVAGKADKVEGAVAGNIAVLKTDGNYEDSGKSLDDFKSGIVTEVKEYVNTSALRYVGGVTFEQLLAQNLLTEEHVFEVYHVSNDFVSTIDFVDGDGLRYIGGVDVAVVKDADGTIKFNALGSPNGNNTATDEEFDEMLLHIGLLEVVDKKYDFTVQAANSSGTDSKDFSITVENYEEAK